MRSKKKELVNPSNYIINYFRLNTEKKPKPANEKAIFEKG